MAKSKVTVGRIGQYVHERTMEKMESGEGDYWQCYHAVLDEDRELKSLYSGLQSRVIEGPEISPSPSSSQAAGQTLHEMTLKFMQQIGSQDYGWCLRQILKANSGSDLVRKYCQL